MTSTITTTTTYWTITSTTGQVAGAAKNHANASLDSDGTVVIKSADGNLWAGAIMTLNGLAGATPGQKFDDLLNTYLTGLLSTFSTSTQRFTFNGVEPTYSTGDPELIIPYDTLQYTGGVPIAVLIAPGVVEIQEGGMYLVSANVTARRTAGATVNDVVPVNINRNGVQDGGRFRATTVDNQRFTLFGTNVLQCSAGDVITFVLPNYTAPPATTYEILNSTNSSGCALNVIKL